MRKPILPAAFMAAILGWLAARQCLRLWSGGQAPEPPIASLPLMARGRTLFREFGVRSQSSCTPVILVRPSCVYCDASAPFRKRLIQTAAAHGGQAMLVVPSWNYGTKAYLTRHAIPRSTRVRTYEDLVRRPAGVPAIALLDSQGIVVSYWYGALSHQEEQAVMAALDCGQGDTVLARRLPSGEAVRDAEQVKALSRYDASVRVVSIEERPAFLADPWPGALNIPLSELEMRLRSETAPNSWIVLDCSPVDDSSCELIVQKLRQRGFRVTPADLRR